MELGKTSHSSYKIRYHMVTAVKYRKALLNNELEKCIRETMKGISERYEIVIDEIGFDQNHIHIFCGAHPSMAPMTILNIIKSITARRIFETFPTLKKKSCGVALSGVLANTSEQLEKPPTKKLSNDTSEIKMLIHQNLKTVLNN